MCLSAQRERGANDLVILESHSVEIYAEFFNFIFKFNSNFVFQFSYFYF